MNDRRFHRPVAPWRAAGALVLALAAGIASATTQEIDRDPGAVSRQAQVYLNYSLAQQALLGRDFPEALDYLDRAAAGDPSPALLLELARLRYAINDLEQAEALALRAAGTAGSAEAHRLLGDIAYSRARQGKDQDANIGRAIDHYRAVLESDPNDLEAAQSLGEIYYQTGRLEEAGRLLRSLQDRGDLDTGLSLLLGKVELRTGRTHEAEEILTPIVERSPQSLEAADALATLYEVQEKYERAVSVYRRLLEHTSPNAYLLDRIGSLLIQSGDYDEAVKSLEAAQAIDPTDSQGLLALARAYEGAGADDRARACYERLLQREAGNLEARFHRARLRQKERDVTEALKEYRDIIDLASGRGVVTPREAAVLALTYEHIGLLELDTRDYEAAAGAFGQALDMSEDPGPEMFLLLARAELQRQRAGEAQRVLEEGQRRFPDDIDLKVFRGEILVVRGDQAGARELYRGLVREQGDTADAYVRVSEALLRQKRFAEAESWLREAMRRHPEDDQISFARGAAMERLGRIGEAERFLAQAIRINPKNAPALNYLGYMLAERGIRLGDSVSYVQRALRLDPRNPAYLDSLGWVQFKMAQYEPAERNLRDAARYDGTDPTIREHLGDLLMATGRREEALQEWEAALARGHEDPGRVRAKIERARSVMKGRP